MPSDVKFIDPLDLDDSFGHFEDFFYYNSAELWTSLAADGGASVADSDAHGGVLVLTTGALDNNECSVATTQAVALPVANKPVVFKGRAKFTEDNTNFAIGLSSIFTAEFCIDDGGGLAASFSGAVFYKADGQTKLQVATSNGATQTKTATNITAGDGVYHTYEITILPYSSTSAEVVFKFDGQQVRDADGETIKHYVLLASLAAMKVGAYTKAGDGTGQVVNIDYLAWRGKR